MSSSKKSFKKATDGDPPEPRSFWRQLFAVRPGRKKALVRRPAARSAPSGAAGLKPSARATREFASGPLLTTGMPLDVPLNPKSFLAKKFNSEVVRQALLATIAREIATPPEDLDPIDRAFWIDGLALKRTMVEGLDCSKLAPDAHLRAIQWMTGVDRLDPRKATYHEDLFVLGFKLGWIADKDLTVPDAAIKGGLALRKLYQVVRQKAAALGDLPELAQGVAATELEAYDRLTTGIFATHVRGLDPTSLLRLANLFLRIDPFRFELTGRHARFEQNVSGLLAELAAFTPLPSSKEA